MLKNIALPRDLEVMAIPPLAMMTVSQAALAMMAAAIRCEHLNLDEIHLYFADGGLPPKSLSLAKTICDRADELINIIDAYRGAIAADVENLKQAADFPF